MQVQRDLDADIVMIFDECTPYPATEAEARASMELSLRWAARSRAEFDRLQNPHALFGIVQGGMYPALAPGIARRPDATSASMVMRSAAWRSASRKKSARRCSMRSSRAPADGPAALPDGRRHARRPGRGGRARHGHVRLRHADAQCAQRPPVHQSTGVVKIRNARYESDTAPLDPSMFVLHLSQLQPCLSATPGSLRRNSGRAARHHS